MIIRAGFTGAHAKVKARRNYYVVFYFTSGKCFKNQIFISKSSAMQAAKHYVISKLFEKHLTPCESATA